MIVGIDLGTTHSLIGCYDETGPRLFANALGEFLTPSVVSVDEAGQVIVGQPARDRLVSHPQMSVASFKRWMGTSRETRLGAHSFRPEELSALILRSLLDFKAGPAIPTSSATMACQRKRFMVAMAVSCWRSRRLASSSMASAP